MTPNALTAWSEIAPRLARFQRLAVFADFDGTLAPIRARPSIVRLPARARRVLKQLAARGEIVGVISGRGLRDLRARVGLSGLWYVGDHGFLLQSPQGATLRLVRRSEQRAIVRVSHRLAASLAGRKGLTVEVKDAGIAVHFRNAPRSSRIVAARLTRRLAKGTPGLRAMAGKCVWEIVPGAAVDKALAVRLILQSERRRASPTILPIYIGDDTADERVFSMRLGLSIAVGPRPSAAAQYALRSPVEVCRWLERLAAFAGQAFATGRRASAARPQTRRE